MSEQLHRLANGTLTETAILASSAYLVKNFTGASGQAFWIVGEPSIVTPYIERERLLSGHDGAFGLPNFQWLFGIMNDAMWHYLYGTVMGSALTADVTATTRNRLATATYADQWITYNCKARLVELTPTGMPGYSGRFWSPIGLEFYDAVINTT